MPFESYIKGTIGTTIQLDPYPTDWALVVHKAGGEKQKEWWWQKKFRQKAKSSLSQLCHRRFFHFPCDYFQSLCQWLCVCIPFDINHDCVIHYFEVLWLRVISLVNIGSELAARTCGKSLNEIKSTADKAANKNLFYFRQIDSQIRIDMIICQQHKEQFCRA